MKILNQIKKQAKNVNATIILPEANMDKRVYNAAKQIITKNLAKIIIFGKEEEFDKTFYSKNCQIIDLNSTDLKKKFGKDLYNLRKHKGLTLKEANAMVKTPIYFANMLLYNNMADGIVAGAKYSTADILRPALQIIKTKPGKSIVTVFSNSSVHKLFV